MNFEQLLVDRLREAIQKQSEDLIAEFKDKMESECRRLVGQVAIDIASRSSIERCGSEILIRLKFDKP